MLQKFMDKLFSVKTKDTIAKISMAGGLFLAIGLAGGLEQNNPQTTLVGGIFGITECIIIVLLGLWLYKLEDYTTK